MQNDIINPYQNLNTYFELDCYSVSRSSLEGSPLLDIWGKYIGCLFYIQKV